DHRHHADRPGSQDAERDDGLLPENQDVERIVVEAIGLRQKAVVRRVVNRAVQHPVEPQEARTLVELVLHLRAFRDLDDGSETTLDRVTELDVVPGVHRAAPLVRGITRAHRTSPEWARGSTLASRRHLSHSAYAGNRGMQPEPGGDGTEMLEGFAAAEVPTGETTIFTRSSGSGPPLLLLHGFPQTHAMWRGVAPRLAHSFTVVCADLRGYGQSGCPVSTPDHAPYAKRAMARDMVTIMERLGFPRFSVAGHDRGGRVAYRMALDHPARVDRLAVLDVVPTETVWDRADARFALGFWPWSLLAQPEPLPERILAAAPEAIVDDALGGWGSPSAAFPPEVRAAYV